MSGYAIVMGPCAMCGAVFGFNPHKVPSIMVNGARVQVCEPCVNRWNAQRVAAGLEAIPPLPGAYEGLPEGEL